MNAIHRKFTPGTRLVAASALALVLAVSFAPDIAGADSYTGAGTAAGAQQQARQRAVQRDYRATHLIGKPVKEDGVVFGRITDVVINMDDGQVRYAILALAGDVGPLEAQRYAIPVRALSIDDKTGDLTMNIPTSRWREKGFAANKWPDLNDSAYWDEVERLSGLPAVQPAERYFAYRASELIGKPVTSIEGKKLGALRDLVIDMNTQRVHYAVLEFEPGVARADKLFQFPISAFDFRENKMGRLETGEPLRLDIEPATLQAMTGFDKNHWPDLNEPHYVLETDQHLKSPAFGGRGMGAPRSKG
jgi:sporulation protein YlmC with PRC-barrel domain